MPLIELTPIELEAVTLVVAAALSDAALPPDLVEIALRAAANKLAAAAPTISEARAERHNPPLTEPWFPNGGGVTVRS
jgi:hypothetical protein